MGKEFEDQLNIQNLYRAPKFDSRRQLRKQNREPGDGGAHL